MHKVSYLPVRWQFEQLVPDEGQLQQLLRTKFKDWEYEKEYRRIVRLHKNCKTNNLHFWPFGSDLDLREVVLGARCKAQKEHLEELLGDGFSRIELVQAPAPHFRRSTSSRTSEG